MEGGGFAPDMMAGQGLPNMVGDVFPPINPTLLPSDFIPALTPTPLPSDVLPNIAPIPLPSDVLPYITPPLLPRVVLPTITPVVVPTTIVREVLTQGNYAYWVTCLTWYLVGQDLWEVCTMKFNDIPNAAQDPVAYSDWRKKNAMALHAIQISCSREMFSQIRDKTLASEAWDFLKRIAYPSFDFDTQLSPYASDEQLSAAASASTGNADFSQYEDLIKALERGSWNDIESFFTRIPDAVRAKISPTGETALHIAARAGHVKVVKELVQKLSPDDLKQKDNLGRTPFAWAARYGFKEIAGCMIIKNKELTSILDEGNALPVVCACNQGQKEMTRFLYSHTPLEELAPGKGKNGAALLTYCIGAKFLDIALEIVDKYPRLAVTLDMEGYIPLHLLGIMPSLFKSGSELWFWQRWIYSCITVKVDHASDQVQVNVDYTTHSRDRSSIEKVLGQLHGLVSYPLKLLGIKNIHDQKLRHAQAIKLLEIICTELQNMKADVEFRVHQVVIEALKRGNVEFVTVMIKSIPKLVWNNDINGRNIFSIAILNRQEKIFNLLHRLNDVNKTKLTSDLDKFGNNMLHLVAMLAPSDQVDGISGAALLMQRELQWFKEVESTVPTNFKDAVNSDGKKPSEVFSEQHAHLVKEGEKWMKEIATSSSFVAALIVTIMFAAAFTIPGGNNDKGTPILLEDELFMVFIISNSISLFSATTSVLMFLGILTSQYAEIKFLTRLPTKLIIGLSTLFVSIAAMMIAFCAALAILLKESSTTVVVIPIILLACVPVTIFALLQFPLLVNIFMTTYWPGIFDRKIKCWY